MFGRAILYVSGANRIALEVGIEQLSNLIYSKNVIVLQHACCRERDSVILARG